MAIKSGRFIFVACCLLVFYTQVQETIAQGEQISQQCLQCICEAASGCDTMTGCKGDVCGPYRITEPYWCDAGKPTLDNDANSSDGGFGSCVGDRSCASRAVEGYMNRFARDCNGDGVINCDDYALIHRLGVVGCNGTIVPEYQNAYSSCMSGGSPQIAGGVQPAYQGGQAGGYPQPNAGGWQQPDRSAQNSCK